MKKIVSFAFRSYHILFPSKVATCRFIPTCSSYSQQAIEKYGLVRGLVYATARILSCHPLTKKPIFDPLI